MIDVPMREGIYLYMRWKSMLYRCEKKVHNYGKLNISVCDEWKGENGFANFEDWSIKHGCSPFLVIDRIDTYGDYCPDNCRWITQKENNRNKINTVFVYDGDVKITLSEYCDIHGLDRLQKQRIYNRIYHDRKVSNDSSLIIHL